MAAPKPTARRVLDRLPETRGRKAPPAWVVETLRLADANPGKWVEGRAYSFRQAAYYAADGLRRRHAGYEFAVRGNVVYCRRAK